MTGIFFAVCDNNEHYFFGTIIIGSVLLCIADFFDGFTDGIEQSGGTTDRIQRLLYPSPPDCLDDSAEEHPTG